jgi:Tfp pilus assembly protein PilP
MRKALVLLSILVTAGCQTTEDAANSFFGCMDSSLLQLSPHQREAQFNKALNTCDEQYDAFIQQVARSVEQRHNWRSLHPSVVPHIREQIEAEMRADYAKEEL